MPVLVDPALLAAPWWPWAIVLASLVLLTIIGLIVFRKRA